MPDDIITDDTDQPQTLPPAAPTLAPDSRPPAAPVHTGGLARLRRCARGRYAGSHRQFRRRSDACEPVLLVCHCLHVRTGTLLLALWHLAVHTLTLSALLVALCSPPTSPSNPPPQSVAITTSTTTTTTAATGTIDVSTSPFGNNGQPSLVNNAVGRGGNGRGGGLSSAASTPPDPPDIARADDDSRSPSSSSFGSSSSVSEGNSSGTGGAIVFESEDAPDLLHSGEVPPPLVMPKHGRGYSVLGGQLWHSDDIHVDLLVTLCLLVITLLMVIGTVRGQASYLMPFFCLQVFDFCFSCLTLYSVFSYLPNAHTLLSQWSGVPLRRQLLLMDPRSLALFLMVIFVFVMVIKAYLIKMVWLCYRYLLMRQARAATVAVAAAAGSGSDPTTGSILPMRATRCGSSGRAGLVTGLTNGSSGLPPDYEAAMHEVRYAKIDLTQYPSPPPSYDAATASSTNPGARK